jgi:hypothetical protein
MKVKIKCDLCNNGITDEAGYISECRNCEGGWQYGNQELFPVFFFPMTAGGILIGAESFKEAQEFAVACNCGYNSDEPIPGMWSERKGILSCQ